MGGCRPKAAPAKILASGTPYTGMIVSFTLEKTKNSTGTPYSKVLVKKSGLLPPAIAAQVVQLRGQIKQQYLFGVAVFVHAGPILVIGAGFTGCHLAGAGVESHLRASTRN